MNEKRASFNHKDIEVKWQKKWQETAINEANISANEAKEPFDKDFDREISPTTQNKPFYNLMMFPYPSAEGLHVGNMYAFTGSDIYGRYKRMQGFNVFEPIGLDGFGIHSENYALKIGKHPMDHAKVTEKKFYNQLHRIGAMFDWTRTVETYDPAYYRWTQWLFVQMFKHGLAYRGKASVNWCPSCKTVLADEQVTKKRVDSSVIPAQAGIQPKERLDPRVKPEDDNSVEVCERCGNKVEKRLLEQWFFKITAYAEKLLQNIVGSGKTGVNLDWSEKIRVAQQNWIGKKEGINITYPVVANDGRKIGEITCFTTRPDTNFGATFVAIAPDHGFVLDILKLVSQEKEIEIQTYIDQIKNKGKQGRLKEDREKTGVFTGLYCLNQLNNNKMSLYVSDFVLITFGTGAVVGVPGHDKRDFEFAKKFDIPIVRVVKGKDGEIEPITSIDHVQEAEGIMINSEFLNGKDIHVATKLMMDYIEDKDWGKRVATYHLRDWLISRQRYWGPPIPMIFCEACKNKGKGERSEMNGWYSVSEDQLPVELPYIEDYKPGDDGIAPLAKHKEFYETTCPGCGGKAVRETDVSDTFLDSSWYFLRYPSVEKGTVEDRKWKVGVEDRRSKIEKTNPPSTFHLQPLSSTFDDPSSQFLPWDSQITKNWLPVHMYTGGAEHSVLHLMYSRFVTMALHDFGYLDFEEPFSHFYAHGLVIKDGAKMSKSKGNVINPDEYIDRYGADAVRLYLMFMGPFNQGGDFRDSAMEGMSRWVGRIWRLVQSAKKQSYASSADIQSALHRLIYKVSDDLEKRHYNTAIASMMEFTNMISDEQGQISIQDVSLFLKLLAPLAPFITEELWHQLQQENEEKDEKKSKNFPQLYTSIHVQPWPIVDTTKVQEKNVTFVIQVNGKVRETISVDNITAQSQSQIEALAKNSPKVQKFFEGKKISRVIFVSGKLINFVVQ